MTFDPSTGCSLPEGCPHEIGCHEYETCIPNKDTGMLRVWPSEALLNLFDPDPADIHLEDIAHSLARQCRYNGHVSGFISVADHCIDVASRLQDAGYPDRVQAQGLLHDAAEAYVGDMVAPLKHLPGMEFYRRVDNKVEEAIAVRFGLPYPWDPAVKQADHASGTSERGPDGLRRSGLIDVVNVGRSKRDYLAVAELLGIS